MLSDQGRLAAAQIDALPDDEKKAAVEHVMTANQDLFPKSDVHRMTLWMTLLVGLFALGIASVIAAAILALNDKDFSAIIALATAVVSGVIGLFAKSPTA